MPLSLLLMLALQLFPFLHSAVEPFLNFLLDCFELDHVLNGRPNFSRRAGVMSQDLVCSLELYSLLPVGFTLRPTLQLAGLF